MTDIFTVFTIIAVGYFLGRLELGGLRLGASGVLLAALFFGHFGFSLPGLAQNLGLVSFVTSVGLIAGPTFIRNLRRHAAGYLLISLLIIFTGALTALAAAKLFSLPMPLTVGIMTGALTSTPGLAAAIEATGDPITAVGYGIAYPFGVVGVVLFVQIIPKLSKLNGQAAARDPVSQEGTAAEGESGAARVDAFGFFPFALAVILGLLIGGITIPLPGDASFSFGASGGPLLSGLLIGHIGRIGKLSLRVPGETLNYLREIGLILFLAAAGVNAGNGFLGVAREYGWKLFIAGVLVTLLPMLIGYWVGKVILKMRTLLLLGSICGGMTSTPALGTLIEVAGTVDVASAYAASYPAALALLVLLSQFIGGL
ncbi:MAG: permease [Peptococcaceae bacterium]|nr:permease [Peptococcaceae bacterium]